MADVEAGGDGKHDDDQGRRQGGVQGDELLEILGAAAGNGRRGDDGDCRHDDPGQSREPGHAKPVQDKGGGAARFGVARHQFGIGETHQRGQHARHQKRDRGGHAGAACDLADENVDAGTDDGAKAVHQQDEEAERPAQAGPRLAGHDRTRLTRPRAFSGQPEPFDRRYVVPGRGAVRNAMPGVGQGTQQRHGATNLGLRWGQQAPRARCGARPMRRHRALRRAAPKTLFAAIESIQSGRKVPYPSGSNLAVKWRKLGGSQAMRYPGR